MGIRNECLLRGLADPLKHRPRLWRLRGLQLTLQQSRPPATASSTIQHNALSSRGYLWRSSSWSRDFKGSKIFDDHFTNYNDLWVARDEKDNYMQSHDVELAKREVLPLVEEEYKQSVFGITRNASF